jgi:hypothetical protein
MKDMMEFHGIWKIELKGHNIDLFLDEKMDQIFGNPISLKVLIF